MSKEYHAISHNDCTMILSEPLMQLSAHYTTNQAMHVECSSPSHTTNHKQANKNKEEEQQRRRKEEEQQQQQQQRNR
jgi:hypothetical protein